MWFLSCLSKESFDKTAIECGLNLSNKANFWIKLAYLINDSRYLKLSYLK